MKRIKSNYVAGAFLCLSMVLAPAALYSSVQASAQATVDQVYTKETPAQYAEEFSDAQPEAEMDEIFITEGQLEPFKQMGLKELTKLGISLPDSFKAERYWANVDEEKGLKLELWWSNPDVFREYVQVYFTGVDIEAGSGSLSFIRTSRCYDMNLLSGFAATGIEQFKENLDIIVPDNFEPTSIVFWQYPDDNTKPSVQVEITWKDPLEKQVMTNLSITGPFPDMVKYSVVFQQADLEKQEGQITCLLRSGVYASQQDEIHPIEDFTEDEMTNMEAAAREFAAKKEWYAGDVIFTRGFNMGEGVYGVMFRFDSEDGNDSDDKLAIWVTSTGKVVGYVTAL